jgi:hypothetical protein
MCVRPEFSEDIHFHRLNLAQRELLYLPDKALWPLLWNLLSTRTQGAAEKNKRLSHVVSKTNENTSLDSKLLNIKTRY